MESYEGSYKYCPRCRCEYLPTIGVCADCGVELVWELPPEPDAPGREPDLEALQSWVGTDPVAVLVTSNEMKAHIARGVLLGADIPCSVWGSGHDGVYGHLAQLAPFPFRLMVH